MSTGKIIVGILIFVSFTAFADENGDTKGIAVDEKASLDKIDSKIDKVLENQEKVKSGQKSSPLGTRKNGVELNLFHMLYIEDDSAAISGGYSRFDHKNGVEWSFPVYASTKKGGYGERSNVLTMDVHYRKFLNNADAVNGFYISGFARLARISGILKNTGYDDREFRTEGKFGLGVGIGYRVFAKNNFYWGTSLSLGRYIVGDNNIFYEEIFNDQELIINVELLKFGYAF